MPLSLTGFEDRSPRRCAAPLDLKGGIRRNPRTQYESERRSVEAIDLAHLLAHG